MKNRGFTLIELIVIICVIAVLATITVVGLGRITAQSRDSQRVASTQVLSEALEKYYDENGEYPSCSIMTGSAQTIQQELGIDIAVLKAPNATSTNSITCNDITASTPDDVFAYIGDGSSKCTGNQACLYWTIKYKEEATGEIKTVESRRKANVAVAPSAPTVATTATLSGGNAVGTAATATCPDATIQYRIDLQVNDGSWQDGAWGTSKTRSTTANQGSQYGFRTNTRCVLLDGTEGSVATGNTAEVIRGISTPSAPVLTATSTGNGTSDSVTWNWSAASCPTGTTAQYSTALYRDDDTAWRAWTSLSNANSRTQATNYQGYKYMVKAKALCKSAYAESAFSAESNAPSFVRLVDKPGVATNFSTQIIDQTQQQALGGQLDNSTVFRWIRLNWTAPSCGSGTTAIRQAWGAFGDTSGGGGYNSDVWTNTAGLSPEDLMNTSKSQWRASTLPMQYWNWAYFQMQNPNTTNVTPQGYVTTNSSYRTPYYYVGGWSPTNATSPEFARGVVVYACINTVTDRKSYYGNYAISPRFTSF